MAAAYLKHEPWEMGVHKRNGVVYLMCINDRKGQKVSWTVEDVTGGIVLRILPLKIQEEQMEKVYIM
ncbi:hypothetical protein ACOSQ4_031583 [Xanthoceras sorbifolium]